MANVIPMAGLGSRYSNAGFTLPKPLIPVSGKPMILRAIEGLPASDKWIFIVRDEHIRKYAIDKLIKTKIPKAIIVPVNETTSGQASSCILALPFLEPNESLFIAACDNSYLYDKKKFARLARDMRVDAVVWTFSKHPSLVERPNACSWVELEKDGATIKNISMKVPISRTPFNDKAIVATFFFRSAQDFKIAYELMTKERSSTNGEYYVDAMPIFYKRMGKKSTIFDVDMYVGWGAPEDLYLFEEREYAIRTGTLNQMPDLNKWKKFIRTLK